MFKFIKIVFISGLTVILAAVIILDSENMLKAMQKSIDSCLYTIIPSLFGFMVISSFLMKSGLYKIIFKPLYLLLRYIIRLNEEEFSVFVLSLIGGYPVGAKLISDVCAEKPDNSLKNMLIFCYCGSPLFIISIVGFSIFGKAEIGLIVYLSNAFANLLICIIYSFLKRSKQEPLTSITNQIKNININQKIFTDSVMSASSSLFPVCAMVIVFGVVIEAINFLFNGSNINQLFYGFLEISRLASISNYDINISMLPIISAITSFGGCCILMQVATITGGRIDLKTFLLLRFPIALLSGIICYIILINTKFSLEVASVIPVIMPTETGNPVASLVLLAMSLLLIISSRKKKKTVVKLFK